MREQSKKKQTRNSTHKKAICLQKRYPFFWDLRASHLAGFVFSGLLAWFAWLQYTVYSDQSVIMGAQLKEMRLEQRPWVYADFWPNGKIYRNQSGGLSIPILFILHNTGHLPAQFVAPVLGARVFGPDPISKVVAAQKRKCAKGIKSGKPSGWGTVFPGQVIKFATATSIDMEDWRSHTMDGVVPGIFVYGCLVYHAAKGKIASTGFAFSVERAGKKESPPLNLALRADPTQIPGKQIRFDGIPDASLQRAN